MGFVCPEANFQRTRRYFRNKLEIVWAFRTWPTLNSSSSTQKRGESDELHQKRLSHHQSAAVVVLWGCALLWHFLKPVDCSQSRLWGAQKRRRRSSRRSVTGSEPEKDPLSSLKSFDFKAMRDCLISHLTPPAPSRRDMEDNEYKGDDRPRAFWWRAETKLRREKGLFSAAKSSNKIWDPPVSMIYEDASLRIVLCQHFCASLVAGWLAGLEDEELWMMANFYRGRYLLHIVLVFASFAIQFNRLFYSWARKLEMNRPQSTLEGE